MADVRSPEWWLRKLHKEILDRRGHAERLWEYYDGEHNLAFTSDKFRQAFGGLFEDLSDNWCDLVVDAVVERLRVEGFRFGDDPEADEDAHRIWQANQLDSDSELAFTEALITGAAVATAWYGDDENTPDLTVTPATSATVAFDPRNRRLRAAGLRLWVDEGGFEHAELFLPDHVWLFQSRRPTDEGVDPASMEWIPDPQRTRDTVPDGPGGRMRNPLGKVPMVLLDNRPRLRAHKKYGLCAQSEIARITSLQDIANTLLADMIIAAERGAMPQRYVFGMELPRDEDGNVVNPFSPKDLVWMAEADPGASSPPQVGQFQAADLRNYVAGIETVVQHIATQTRTPPHYFYLGGNFPSGESIKSAEVGLVAKTTRQSRHFGEDLEELMRCGFAVIGDPRADEVGAEVIWSDPEYRTEGEHVDALMKLSTLGIPKRQLWEDAGYTPQQIARFEAMQSEDDLRAAVFAPPEPETLPVV